ncbi:MAG: type domain protein, partial [Verrucomicrobia bacterium]|nr:type domain protein [Verrucomicrobiota bacterium]
MKICRSLLCWFVTCVLLASHSTGTAQTPRTEPNLFLETAPATTSEFALDPNARRQRVAMIDRDVLAALSVQPAPARLTVNLFTNFSFTAVMNRREMPGPGRVTLSGQLAGIPGSMVVFATQGDILIGSISIPGRDTWRIGYAGDGWHRIVELDPAKRLRCGVNDDAVLNQPPQPALGLQAVVAPPPLLGSSSPITRVDVMVVYTADARASAGSTEAMHAAIDAAVMEANTIYARSLVNMQIRLVHRAEVTYTETGVMQTDLNRVRATSDGFMDNVHTLRDTHGADLVCLVTDSSGSEAGLASQMLSPPSTSFAPQGFSVVLRSELVGTYTFAHELGHNMGCAHDRANSTFGGAYSYSYGYAVPVGGFTYGTVMSYVGAGIPHFSNPDVLYRGVATGVASGPTAANNALTLNNTAPIVSAFRGAAVSTFSPVTTITSPTQQQYFPDVGSTVTINVTATDSDGTVARVDFFANGFLIGSDMETPFTLDLNSVLAGSYELVARATDNLGVAGDSAPVYVIVGNPAP